MNSIADSVKTYSISQLCSAAQVVNDQPKRYTNETQTATGNAIHENHRRDFFSSFSFAL